MAIVWDEFGQHLETLVREGRSEDLLAVQDLAEWTVRRSRPAITFTTLMHQGVHSYARRVSDTGQSAWRKIEGRFDTLSLVDDGVDAYEMLADVLRSDRRGNCVALARRARAAGFFPAIGDEETLAGILTRTAPLAPAALDVLPRLAAQVAQNERTAFQFLAERVAVADADDVVGLDAVYDYFRPAMQADTGPGGTHRRFVEAETALSRAETDLQRDVLKAAALLQLGGATERIQLPIERLLFAVTGGTRVSREDAEAAIKTLIDRKTLIHRRRIDDVSVWHGPDLDLAGMISEEAVRISLELDISATLERLFPPDAYTAPEYNHERSITRFARARYVSASDLLDERLRDNLRSQANEEDALVALVVDATLSRSDLLSISETLPPHLVVAIADRATEVGPILADLVAIETLLERPGLLDSDPLIARELDEFRAESETALRHALDRLMNPDRGEVIWVSGGRQYDFAADITPGNLLTEIFEARFAETPRIRNEQVVRRKVTTVTRSARKRCILAIIERTGLPALGYQGATSADASIYRTVFEKTGLYRRDGEAWIWDTPAGVAEPGLRRVWEIAENFFTQPADQPKCVETLFDRLTAPPIGLRDGVLPLMFAAGLQAFARTVALLEVIDGRHRYVDDINATVIERVCELPARFHLAVVSFTPEQMQTLKAFVRDVAGSLDPHEPDLIRAFYDGVLKWKNGLPRSALTAVGLGRATSIVQPFLRRENLDPLIFLTRDLPEALDEPPLSDNCLHVFSTAIAEMEAVSENYAHRAAKIAEELFNARILGNGRSLLQAAEEWGNALPLDDKTTRALDQEALGILSRAKSAQTSSRGERGLVTAFSGILSGTLFEDWDEESVTAFRDRLESVILRVEDFALENYDGSFDFEPLIKNRIASVFDQFSSKIGPEKLMQYMQDIYQERA